MVKRERTKGQAMITKDTHKAKDRVTRTPHFQVPFSDFYA
jgi:hypothetical protein